jgi:chromosome segregation ATPase
MKYVKLTQAQLDEIQELIDTKNKTIESLQTEVNLLQTKEETFDTLFNSATNIRAERDFYKDDNKKMCNELDLVEAKLDDALQTISDLSNENVKNEKNYLEAINDLQQKNNALNLDLSIQRSVNKAAIELLNETKCEKIPKADLTNILDIKV